MGRKFCSHFCYSQNKKGKKHTHGFKISLALQGKPKSKEHIAKVVKALTGRKRPEITGNKHPLWKGNNATYGSIHDWVSRHLGTPKICSHCGNSRKKIYYQWANISGNYKRDLSDWVRLCVKCHRKKDKNKTRAGLIYEKRNGAYVNKKNYPQSQFDIIDNRNKIKGKLLKSN